MVEGGFNSQNSTDNYVPFHRETMQKLRAIFQALDLGQILDRAVWKYFYPTPRRLQLTVGDTISRIRPMWTVIRDEIEVSY